MRGIISRYSLPKSFCDALLWVIYRIGNAIASLCGMSDWQRAQTMIQDRTFQIVLSEGIVDTQPLERNDGSYRANAARLIDIHSSIIGNNLLDLCLQYNSEELEEAPIEISAPYFNLTDLTGALRSSIENLRVQALSG